MRLSKSHRWWEGVSGPGYRSPGIVHAPYFPVPPPDGFIIQKGWKTGKPFITLVFTETFLFALMKWQIGSWEFGRGMFALLFRSGICGGHKYYWRVTLAQTPGVAFLTWNHNAKDSVLPVNPAWLVLFWSQSSHFVRILSQKLTKNVKHPTLWQGGKTLPKSIAYTNSWNGQFFFKQVYVSKNTLVTRTCMFRLLLNSPNRNKGTYSPILFSRCEPDVEDSIWAWIPRAELSICQKYLISS